jgi:hypothetical protein
VPPSQHHVTFSTSESCNKNKKEKIEIETGFRYFFVAVYIIAARKNIK